MSQEDKELLLKDLCARLPYKPIVHIDDCGIWDLRGIDHDDSAELRDRVIVWHGENYPSSKNSFPIINCKPYLFPLSSMTEEQKKDIFCNGTFFISNRNELGRFPKHSDDYDYVTIDDYLMIYKKLIENHFDVNGLIPKGLAIDATSLQIY